MTEWRHVYENCLFVVLERFFAMKNCNGTYYTTVIVDTERDVIIGAASLIVEKKFIHDCAVVSYIVHLLYKLLTTVQ